MGCVAHGLVGFRASPRLYRGEVLLFALPIAIASLAEALRADPKEEAATPAEAEVIERIVLDDTAGDFAPEPAARVAPAVVRAEVAGPFAAPLAPSCAACGCTAGYGATALPLPIAARARRPGRRGCTPWTRTATGSREAARAVPGSRGADPCRSRGQSSGSRHTGQHHQRDSRRNRCCSAERCADSCRRVSRIVQTTGSVLVRRGGLLASRDESGWRNGGVCPLQDLARRARSPGTTGPRGAMIGKGGGSARWRTASCLPSQLTCSYVPRASGRMYIQVYPLGANTRFLAASQVVRIGEPPPLELHAIELADHWKFTAVAEGAASHEVLEWIWTAADGQDPPHPNVQRGREPVRNGSVRERHHDRVCASRRTARYGFCHRVRAFPRPTEVDNGAVVPGATRDSHSIHCLHRKRGPNLRRAVELRSDRSQRARPDPAVRHATEPVHEKHP